MKRRIKWEMVNSLIMTMIAIVSLVKHIMLNGFYLELGMEIIIYYLFTITIYYVTKNIHN